MNEKPTAEAASGLGACVWTEDRETHEVFDTTCGNRFEFNDQGPDENDFKFCPYCGKRLAAVYEAFSNRFTDEP